MCMRLATLVCAITMLCQFGCIGEKPYGSVPPDLRVEVEENACPLGGMHIPDWTEKVSIDASGNGVYEHLACEPRLIYCGDIERKTFRLSEEELSSLYGSMEDSGFFEMRGDDTNICGFDECSKMRITRNGLTKEYPRREFCRLQQFNDAERLIWGIAQNKTKYSR